ncbi:MAG: type II secretion system F family protein, partial [Candidatus Omnitrophica bacterium]|nr:type II secretion system F family protein [Candidatus Omnitrophota bacterium]
MPKYFYVARNKAGTKVNGVEEGLSQDEIVSRLQAKDLLVVNVTGEDSKGAPAPLDAQEVFKSKFKPKYNRITAQDLTLFCRQLATLLGAGVTILRSLDIISNQVSSRRLQGVIKDLEKNMEAGLSFHDAMSKHSNIFSEFWIHLVESGEASGNLAVVLSRLAAYLERYGAFKKKIISALIYPAILLVAGIAALLFMTIKIVPTFANIFSGFNIKLPFLTVLLVEISKFIRGYFLVIIAVLVIGSWLIRRYIATREGRKRFERFLLQLPGFGEFFRTLVIERFTSEMSTLVESGVPILYSLEISERSVDNLVLGDII